MLISVVPAATSMIKMLSALRGIQYILPSCASTAAVHLRVESLNPDMVVRSVVSVAGSIISTDCALWGGAYSLPSGPTAMPNHFSRTYPVRLTAVMDAVWVLGSTTRMRLLSWLYP